jgi:hypothetical protein
MRVERSDRRITCPSRGTPVVKDLPLGECATTASGSAWAVHPQPALPHPRCFPPSTRFFLSRTFSSHILHQQSLSLIVAGLYLRHLHSLTNALEPGCSLLIDNSVQSLSTRSITTLSLSYRYFPADCVPDIDLYTPFVRC